MKDKHLSIRVPERLHHRLTERAGGGSRSALALRLIEEGLRMDEHPGVYFRSGASGRRPRVVGGPDVWMLGRLFRELDETGEDLIRRSMELSGQPAHIVRIAERYYRAFRHEVDAWMDALDEFAERERARASS